MIAIGNTLNTNDIELLISEGGCVANPGNAFQLPAGFDAKNARKLIAGEQKFSVDRVEGFLVVF